MTEPTLNFPKPSQHHGTRYRVCGLFVSAAIHLSAVIALVVVSMQPWYWDARVAREGRVIYASIAEVDESESAEPEVRTVTDPDEVTGSMIVEKIEQVADEARQRSDEENLDRLEQASKRLSSVASAESVDNLADAFQALTGTQSRAERPVEEPVAGEFNFDTAQFHDVRRVENDNGSFQYLCILVDAEGRTTEVVMTEAEGQTAYETMQRIKQNPLLERVYRRIAMPLFDKMLAGAREAAAIADDFPQEQPATKEGGSTPSEVPEGSQP